MIRILVADDQAAARANLRALLAVDPEIEVVGESTDGPSTVLLARSLTPDLVVLNDSMPGNGIDLMRTLGTELPDTGFVLLGTDPALRDKALAAGAAGYVQRNAPVDDVLGALQAAASALVARRRFSDVPGVWRRTMEILLDSGAITEGQIGEVLAEYRREGSLADALRRRALVTESDLADALARARAARFISLAPYPEIGEPIAPAERRLSSARLIDPVDPNAARRLPLDVARSLGLVVIAATGRHGVVAMAHPLDETALAEAERRTRLRLFRVAASAEDVQDALLRVWTRAGTGPVVASGTPRAPTWSLAVLASVSLTILGLFTVAFREVLAPRYAFCIVALCCGAFFFLYALKYYVTTASVMFLALFGNPLSNLVRGSGNGQGGVGPKALTEKNVDGAARGAHKEGYRTLRGEALDPVGSVMVVDAWPKTEDLRLPAERQPFVSVHLALYNEKRVVDRLLTACTSFDYENYEVIVVDDSTDETIQILKQWSEHSRVHVLHRPSRKGFKGGALQEALRRMNPKAEYVMVFDADFVPPADAIWHFLDYFGRLARAKNGNGNGHAKGGNGNGTPQNGDRVAAVQGYQWHMLNASENWITKGVRAEFSGSYVLERAGQELFGAMKMISGSVYMIRADVLRKLGWSTSITEDWELTIRLYLAGYKVLYTPYIQAPAECVSTVRRLIKQRMRWAEGHTFNVKKYFWQVLRSPNLTWQEKLEFVYYGPYYLQSVLFGLGTLTWLLGTYILGQKLPMWGELLGWALVVSNALALPLMNLGGVLLEGSLKRDAAGVLSFVGLSWLLVPFQSYASLKGLLERDEGGWTRTPKSGRITETLDRFRLARLMPWELPSRKRPGAKRHSRGARVAAMCLLALAAGAIITVGALSARAASASGVREPTEYAIPTILGTAVPLTLLALGWLRLRRRATAAFLAIAFGLSVNVAFLADAVPAEASAGTSSDFYLSEAATTFGCAAAYDMYQTSPTSPGTFSFPGGSGVKDTFCSDTFTTGMALNAGSATANVYMWNTSASKSCTIALELLWFHAATATTTSLGTASTSLAPNIPVTLITKTFATLPATFVTGDRIEFSVSFTSPGANCNNSFFAAGTSTYPSRITVATIVPEGIAGLLLLAPALPLAARWWKRRRP